MLSLTNNFRSCKSSTVAATQTGISSFNLIKSAIISTLDFLFSLSRPSLSSAVYYGITVVLRQTVYGIIQGDLSATAIYVIAIIPLILMLVNITHQDDSSTKTATYADDFTAAGKITQIGKK